MFIPFTFVIPWHRRDRRFQYEITLQKLWHENGRASSKLTDPVLLRPIYPTIPLKLRDSRKLHDSFCFLEHRQNFKKTEYAGRKTAAAVEMNREGYFKSDSFCIIMLILWGFVLKKMVQFLVVFCVRWKKGLRICLRGFFFISRLKF